MAQSSRKYEKQFISAAKFSPSCSFSCVHQLQFPQPRANFEDKVLKMGWVREKTLNAQWRWRYLVLTDSTAALYDKAPDSSAQLANFVASFALVETKQKQVNAADFGDAVEEGIKFAFALINQKGSCFIATGKLLTSLGEPRRGC